MALVRCDECGHTVSDRAHTCPSCGAPGRAANATAVATDGPRPHGDESRDATRALVLIVGAAIVVAFLGWLILGRSHDGSDTADQERRAGPGPGHRATARDPMEGRGASVDSTELAEVGSAFGTFVAETTRLTEAIGCQRSKVVDAQSPPALWACVGGAHETVKVFVNETDSGGGVKSVKFLWNDWTKDGGYGLHADREVALAWVAAIATVYAPSIVTTVVDAFNGRQERTIESAGFVLRFTYHRGPAIDERMIVITAR